MAKHIFKMVWNRKGANALITLEIFMSFLVVFAVVALSTHFWSLYGKPLGFDYQNVYDVGISTGQSFLDELPTDMAEKIDGLARELETLDPVEAAAISVFEPFINGSSNTDFGEEAFRVETELMRVSLPYLEVMRLQLLAGRWFEQADQHLHWTPVVVTPELARNAFGDADPVGQVVVDTDEDEGTPEEYRIVGVVDTFRRRGEFARPDNVLFRPLWPDGPVFFPRRHLQVRVVPGTPASFEETMIKRLEALAPEWSFTAKRVEDEREAYLRRSLAPLFVAGLVATFLMVMVALGLVGVLWQNVTRRTRELGLRRAKGATARNIHRQILAELAVVTGLGVALACVVVAQVPVLGIFELDLGVFGASMALSIAILFLLSGACGLYPSWLATRVSPAEALHYE